MKRNWILSVVLIVGMREMAAAADEPQNKLTIAYYDFSSGKNGVDINLRHKFKKFESSTAWIGGYRENSGFDQVRVGYQYDYQHNLLAVQTSGQAATHGFVGFSIYAEAGHDFFAIGGVGQTNLHPYWNLGFDPNDYVEFGGGYRHAGSTVSVFAIRDDRLGTGQTNTHLYFRRYLPHTWRLTLDIANEHGRGDEDVLINSWSTSLDVDWRRWFVRVARDPHVNYTPDRQWRVATGVRF